MKTIFGLSRHRFRASIWFLTFTRLLPRCGAQSTLSLQEAFNKAVESRAGLRAEADRVSIAQGFERQSRRIANPTFQFENQNLRPGQNYSVDVDTYAYLTQPLDILGKRKQRIAVASQGVVSSQAGYDLVRRQIVEAVKHAYWDARGAQELREVLKATVENFQSIVDYHSAQFNVGAIPEQDLLRIRLESERLQIDASLAAMPYVTFNSVKQALLVVLVVGNVTFALIGGIAALWIRGMNLNLSASIGFIALFGVAMLNGVVLVSSINQLRLSGQPTRQAVLDGARRRLRPVLMTACVASFGFIPMATATSTGAEVQCPLASVVIGGLFSATLLTLFLLPVLYDWALHRAASAT